MYVGDEHVGTFFEGCVFRMAQGKFTALLARKRGKELAGVSHNLEKIRRIATPATTEEFGKFARFQE